MVLHAGGPEGTKYGYNGGPKMADTVSVAGFDAQHPLTLTWRNKTLVLPTNPELRHPLHQKLRLLMYHLSGDPSKIETVQAKLCPSCFLGDKEHEKNTPLTSVNGNSSVVMGKLITFLPIWRMVLIC